MIKRELEKIISDAAEAVGFQAASFSVEPPADRTYGDYATNIALLLAKEAKKPPREVAEAIAKNIARGLVSKVEVAGAGFINLTLSPERIVKELSFSHLGTAARTDKPQKINLEFISANPTGELHLGHGRGAFFGDVLASIYEEAGHTVTREFYINDSRESTQIKELGKTALGKGEQYKTDLVKKLIAENNFSGMSESDAGFALGAKLQAHNQKFIEETLRIRYDEWFSEDKELRAGGKGHVTIETLKKMGVAYEHEGAWWLKTKKYGDDEDRVIVRSDGTPSYFLSDIAYHIEKARRGYDEMLNVWGADHHGHVKRMNAVAKMFGWPKLEIFVAQLVSLKEGGVAKKMSKRLGTIVLLRDLIDEVGIDVVRWFFAERALSTHMEFDVELAKEQSEKNPVFYVQYAHARLASIFRKAGFFDRISARFSPLSPEFLFHSSARTLAMKLIEYPEVIARVIESKDKEVQRLPLYAYELATVFSAFYRDVRVIGENGRADRDALVLCMLTKKMLAHTLSLLGISAPERM